MNSKSECCGVHIRRYYIYRENQN